MTMEEFKAALDADPEKSKAFEQALRNTKEDEVGSTAEALKNAAAAAGFELSLAEIERSLAAEMELDDEELASVGGGGEDWLGRDDNCFINWHCNYAFLHNTNDNDQSWDEDTSCWSDHNCLMSHHKYCGSNYRSYCIWAWEHE